MAKTPQNNFFDEEQSQNKQIGEFLTQFMNPQLATWLSGIIQGSLRGASQTGTPGMGFGQSAVFGPTNAAHAMYSRMQMDNLDRLQTKITAADNMGVAKFREQTLSALNPNLSQAELTRQASSFSLTNMAVDWMYEKATGAQAFQEHAKVAAMWGGFGSVWSPSGPDASWTARNDRMAGVMGDMTSFISKPGSGLYGLKGEQTGQLITEMGRTGMLGYGMDVSGKQMTSNVQNTLTQWASAVEPMSQFFGDDISKGMDGMSNILGVSAMATFGGQAGDMMRGLRAGGRVMGYSNNQMLHFATQSAVASRAYGSEQTSAIGNGIVAAQMFRAATSTPDGLQLVNEQQFRENIIQRTAGAGASDMARMVSGAAIMAGDKAGAFMEQISSAGVLSASKVASIASEYGGVEGSASDMQNAGYSREAQLYRANNQDVTRAVLGSNIDTLEKQRRDILTQQFGADVAGSITDTTRSGLSKVLNKSQMGIADRLFDRQAQQANYQNASAVDSAIRARTQKDFLNKYVTDTNNLTSMDKTSAGMFKEDLTQATRNALAAAAGGDAEALNVINVMRGKNYDISHAMATSMSSTYGNVMGAIKGTTGTEGEIQQLGMGVFAKMITTGMLGDQKLTKEQFADYESQLASDPKVALAMLARKGEAGKMFSLDVLQDASAMAKGTDKSVESFKGIARTRATLAALSADKSVSADLDIDKGAIDRAYKEINANTDMDKWAKNNADIISSVSRWTATDKDASHITGGAFAGTGDVAGLLQLILNQLSSGITINGTVDPGKADKVGTPGAKK